MLKTFLKMCAYPVSGFLKCINGDGTGKKKKNLFEINCVREEVNKQKGRDKHISFNLVLDSL